MDAAVTIPQQKQPAYRHSSSSSSSPGSAMALQRSRLRVEPGVKPVTIKYPASGTPFHIKIRKKKHLKRLNNVKFDQLFDFVSRFYAKPCQYFTVFKYLEAVYVYSIFYLQVIL